MSRSLASYSDAERPRVIARRLKAKKVGLGQLAAKDAPKGAVKSAKPAPAVEVEEVTA